MSLVHSLRIAHNAEIRKSVWTSLVFRSTWGRRIKTEPTSLVHSRTSQVAETEQVCLRSRLRETKAPRTIYVDGAGMRPCIRHVHSYLLMFNSNQNDRYACSAVYSWQANYKLLSCMHWFWRKKRVDTTATWPWDRKRCKNWSSVKQHKTLSIHVEQNKAQSRQNFSLTVWFLGQAGFQRPMLFFSLQPHERTVQPWQQNLYESDDTHHHMFQTTSAVCFQFWNLSRVTCAGLHCLWSGFSRVRTDAVAVSIHLSELTRTLHASYWWNTHENRCFCDQPSFTWTLSWRRKWTHTWALGQYPKENHRIQNKLWFHSAVLSMRSPWVQVVNNGGHFFQAAVKGSCCSIWQPASEALWQYVCTLIQPKYVHSAMTTPNALHE